MTVRTINNKKIIIVDGQTILSFISAVGNFNENDNLLTLSDNLNLEFENIDNHLNLKFNNSAITSNAFLMKISFDMLLDISENVFVFSSGKHTYVLHSDNCTFEFDKENVLTIRIGQNEGILNLYYYQDFYINLQSFINNVNVIDEKTVMPEFSISVFDDSLMTKPRPVRQGVPIVSTVPTFIDSTSSSTDVNFYELGKGPDKKTLYFRIICNKVMENISVDQESAMKLKVYMPNGLDTVKTAIYRPMYLLQANDTTNNISIYYATHDFYVQGYFGGIEYVDGYMYCDVHVPLTITNTMAIELDFLLY